VQTLKTDIILMLNVSHLNHCFCNAVSYAHGKILVKTFHD